jgi:hypothetical protein
MLFQRSQKRALAWEWRGANMTQKQNNAKEQPDYKEIFGSDRDGIRALVQQVVQDVLEAEMDEALGAAEELTNRIAGWVHSIVALLFRRLVLGIICPVSFDVCGAEHAE